MITHPILDGLPNAKYINLILESLNKHTICWAYYFEDDRGLIPRKQVREAERSVVQQSKRLSEIDIAWDIAWSAVRSNSIDKDFSWSRALDAAWPALLALILYDDSHHLLFSDQKELKILHALGDEIAIFFYYAAAVFKELKVTKVN